MAAPLSQPATGELQTGTFLAAATRWPLSGSQRQQLLDEWLTEIGALPRAQHLDASTLAAFGGRVLEAAWLRAGEGGAECPGLDCDLETLVHICARLRRCLGRLWSTGIELRHGLEAALEAQEQLQTVLDQCLCQASRRVPSPRTPTAPPAATGSQAASTKTASLGMPHLEGEGGPLLALLEQLPAGVVLVSAETRELILLNDEGKRLTGLHPRGFALDRVLEEGRACRPNGEPWPAAEDPMVLALSGTSVRNAESIFLCGDGTRRSHLLNAGPVRDRAGRVVAGLLTIVDITERKAMEEELRNAALFRERFMGILGHDLRSPLNAIHLSAQLLKRASPTPAVETAATRILASADRMARMISDLLDFTRGRFGQLPVNARPMGLSQLCEDVVGEVRAAHPDRAIELRLHADARGVWDRDRLEQALSNLLTNALVHGSPRAAVVLSVEQTARQAILRVQNQGAPIPAHALADLFDPFRRLAQGGAGNGSGLGLGLHIVRSIAIAHGGSVEVSSSAEAGTMFSLLLPLAS